MRTLLTLLIVGVVTACTATPVENPWDDISVSADDATRPVHCGSFPLPDVFDGDNITYSAAGVRALDTYRVCAEGNHDIADAHADQIEEHRRAAQALVDAGRHQKRIADMRAEMLADERRHMVWERVQYWVVIVAMAAAL